MAEAAGGAAADMDDDSFGDYSGSLDSDSSEEPVDEPHLKYERMGSHLALLLAEESASCLCVHPKLVLVGTAAGRLHVFDHLGNRVRPARQPHTLAVNEISADEPAEHVASCADDGSVVVHGLYASDDSHRLTFDGAVRSVALEPAYSRPGARRRFVVADTRVHLYERTFLSRLRGTVLHEGDGGPVQALCWNGPLLAWACAAGVRVFHTELRRVVSLIRCEVGGAGPRCHLVWRDAQRLLIGWDRSVQQAALRPAPAGDAAPPQMEITHRIHTEFVVCGVAGCGDDLVLLSQSEQHDPAAPRPRPQVRVIRPLVDDYEELSTDELTVRGYQRLAAQQYRLQSLPAEGALFVLSPRDVIVARPRDADDHVDWLLERGRYEAALRQLQVAGAAARRHSVPEVGRRYLDSLLQREQFEQAAALCHTVFGRNRALWEEEVYRFAALRQLKAISAYLPRGDFRLDSTVYEMVLYNLMRTEVSQFLRLVREWSPSLYNSRAVVNAVLEQLLRDVESPQLLLALALLYTHQGCHDKALAIYLKLGHAEVFELVSRHGLHAAVAEQAAAVVRIDAARAVDVLTERPQRAPPARVVQQLESQPVALHAYLWRLQQRHRQLAAPYQDRLVELLADYERPRLAEFLRASGGYSLQRALHVCRTRCLAAETVYLLGRTGATREALHLIMTQMEDVAAAIAFCKEHSDTELWDDLIAYCVDQPTAVKQLLLSVGWHADPRRLVRRIADGLHIPGLRDALAQLLHDHRAQRDLQLSCRRLLTADLAALHGGLRRRRAAALPLPAGAVCGQCRRPLLQRESSRPGDAALFQCRHGFHTGCLPTGAGGRPLLVCTVCRAQPPR